MRIYELVFIADPGLDEDGLNALSDRVQQMITTNGGEIVKVEKMGRRRLAYPIAKRHEGLYVLMHARLDRPAMQELERSLKLAEEVLRYLLVRVEEPVVAPEVEVEGEAAPEVETEGEDEAAPEGE